MQVLISEIILQIGIQAQYSRLYYLFLCEQDTVMSAVYLTTSAKLSTSSHDACYRRTW